MDHYGYCFVCRIRDHYYSSGLEEIKHGPDKIIRLAVELFADVNLCYKYDKTLAFWKKDFEYKETFLGGNRRNFVKRL